MNFASVKFFVDFNDGQPYAYDFSFSFKLKPEFDTERIKDILKKELLKNIQGIVKQHKEGMIPKYGFFVEASDEALRSK